MKWRGNGCYTAGMLCRVWQLQSGCQEGRALSGEARISILVLSSCNDIINDDLKPRLRIDSRMGPVLFQAVNTWTMYRYIQSQNLIHWPFKNKQTLVLSRLYKKGT